MDHIKKMAAMAALNDMFKQGYFSIRTIDSVSKMLNVNPKGNTYNILSTLHCVSFDQMPKELRVAIPNMVRECLALENEIYEFDFLKSEKKLVDAYISPVSKLLNYVKG